MHITSLNRSRDTLDDYFHGRLNPLVPRSRPWAIPSSPVDLLSSYPTKFKEHQATEFQESEHFVVPDAAPTDVTVLTKVRNESMDRVLLIKFVSRCGVEVHETLSRREEWLLGSHAAALLMVNKIRSGAAWARADSNAVCLFAT